MNQLTIFQPPVRSYHNTLPVKGEELIKREEVAKSQDEFILRIFQANPDQSFTAWEMYNKVQDLGRTMIKDSVKRSITNLMKQGNVYKTNEMRDGEFKGFKNKAYQLIK